VARPSKNVVAATWILTIAGCALTLTVGFSVLFAMAFTGLLALFQSSPAPPKVGNADLLLALLPAALAVIGNAWVLWGRTARAPGVSPWWLAPSLAIAVATFAFGAYVCVDVWEVDPSAASSQKSSP
jgi:uncharacterized membrane protein